MCCRAVVRTGWHLVLVQGRDRFAYGFQRQLGCSGLAFITDHGVDLKFACFMVLNQRFHHAHAACYEKRFQHSIVKTHVRVTFKSLGYSAGLDAFITGFVYGVEDEQVAILQRPQAVQVWFTVSTMRVASSRVIGAVEISRIVLFAMVIVLSFTM